MAVAKGYRDRHLPADVLVVDWFYYTKMGQMDMDPKYWPDPAAMNKQLHAHGLRNHDQRLAALRARRPLLCRIAQEWLVHPPRRRHAHQRPALRPRRLRHRHHQPRSRCLVLEDNPRQHPQQGLRLALGRRDRARSAAQWRLLSHWPRHTILQRLSALSHRGALRRLPQGRADETRPDPLSRRLSRRAAQRRHLLVV